MRAGARGGSWWLRALVLLYGAGLLLVEIGRLAGPERWWPTCLNLYLPQGAWALPGILLLLLTLALDRRFALVPALCLAWVLGPLMGLSLAVARPSAPAERRVRVMTYNVKWAHEETRAARVTGEVIAADPDLLLLQDVNHLIAGYPSFAAFLGTRHVARAGFYLVASRFPLSPLEDRPLGPERYARTRIEIRGTTIVVYNVHLMTPRDGLEAMPYWLNEGIEETLASARTRLEQVEQLKADLAREAGPVVLAGDLNAPPESLVMRGLLADRFRDAFAAAGRGYGYTYGHSVWPHVSYMRIDHVLFSRELIALDSWVGGRTGSAHRPVVADLALAGS
ncbi:MAG TPA: endonuclease/exonuclease/phosphatase family protein [Methylomirabilota bacterium]